MTLYVTAGCASEHGGLVNEFLSEACLVFLIRALSCRAECAYTVFGQTRRSSLDARPIVQVETEVEVAREALP